MFKLVIVDLMGILSNNGNEYSILKKITNFKGTAQSLKAYLGDAYEKLLSGKITEKLFWQKAAKESKTRKKPESIKKEFMKSFSPIFDKELLKKARQNFSFALCSNFYKPWHEEIKKKHKYAFDYESLSSEAKIKKDDKKMYLSAMLNFKLKPEQCVVASDEASDLLLAKELGMKTLFIPGKTKEFKGADYYYETFNDFLAVLI
ncbi:MAG: HAD hydrolase-like protein [Candidatus Nanoarchaeia archaeon]|nr:HAD hydrolase-like protein [Candidatus Nanoarchaeia archaeon]